MPEINSNVPVKKFSGLPKLFKFVKYNIISYIISLILIVVLSAVICFTGVPESFASPCIKIITFAGVFIAAFLCARSSDGKGWFSGMIAGVMNIGVLFAAVLISTGDEPDKTLIAYQIMTAALVGAFGGIIGINAKKH